LPAKHLVAKLLVREIHSKVKQGGINTTLVATHEKYWILKGRQLIKHSCVVCKKVEGSPYCIAPLLLSLTSGCPMAPHLLILD